MQAQPDVSVIIAAWKAADFIEPAIRSALSQTGVTLEVIVVDDCSPDDTSEAALIAADGDARLKVVRLAENGGPSIARNVAIDHAHGRYVAVLDSDDRMAPGRLASLVTAGDAANADIIVDNVQRVDADGVYLDAEPFLSDEKYKRALTIDLQAYIEGNKFMSGGRALGYLKPLFKVETLRAHGLKYDASLRNSEDYYLVADLLALGAKMIYEPVEGYLYRVDVGSISHRLKPALTEALIGAEKEFQARHKSGLNSSQQSALDERLTRLENAHAYICFVEGVKSRKVVSAVGALAARPSAFGFVAHQIGDAVRQKLNA